MYLFIFSISFLDVKKYGKNHHMHTSLYRLFYIFSDNFLFYEQALVTKLMDTNMLTSSLGYYFSHFEICN